MSIKDLMGELNASNFQIFPQKGNPGKFTASIAVGEDRFFVSRVASAELNEDGSAKYIWARGQQMQSLNTQN